MKWKNEMPNKAEFMKISSFNFIAGEKLFSELVHERNAGQTRRLDVEAGQKKEVKQTRSTDSRNSDEENRERVHKTSFLCQMISRTKTAVMSGSVQIEKRSKYIPAKIKRDDNGLFVQNLNKNVKVRTMTETITLAKSSTDFTGSSPKRYTTKCFIKPVPTPVWYAESLFFDLDSNKRRYDEKIYFKQKMVPFKWSESMITEVETGPKCVHSDFYIPVEDYRDEVCYVSLESQQKMAQSTEL